MITHIGDRPEVFETTGAIAGLDSMMQDIEKSDQESQEEIAQFSEQLCEDYQELAEAIIAANRKPKPRKSEDRQSDRYQQELIALFFYRTKIVKAFQDSRSVDRLLDRAYLQLETNLDHLQTEMETARDVSTNYKYLAKFFNTQLKNLAIKSLPYTRLLRKMAAFSNTIEINLYNYNEKINQICAKMEAEKEEVFFLKEFGEKTAPHFRRQIQADLDYFEHGTDLVNTAIASIRGIIEVENLNKT